MRLGLIHLCGDFGEFWIIFVACESFYHVWLFYEIVEKDFFLGHKSGPL